MGTCLAIPSKVTVPPCKVTLIHREQSDQVKTRGDFILFFAGGKREVIDARSSKATTLMLTRAPQTVQNFYETCMTKNKGLFKIKKINE